MLNKMYKVTVFMLLLTSLACSQKKGDQNSTDFSKSSPFKLYGNYLPTKEIFVQGLVLQGIKINTHDSLNYSPIKGILLRFRDKAKDDYYFVDCSFRGTQDDFIIIGNDAALGKIQVRGKFFGTKGPVNDNIKDPNTIVFKGVFSVDGKTNIEFECRYFEGD